MDFKIVTSPNIALKVHLGQLVDLEQDGVLLALVVGRQVVEPLVHVLDKLEAEGSCVQGSAAGQPEPTQHLQNRGSLKAEA